MKRKLTMVLAHVAGWILFLSLVIGFVNRSPAGDGWFSSMFSAPFLIFCAVFLFLFYFNTYFLIPAFYLRRKYTVYIISVVILFIGVFFIRPFDRLMNDFTRNPDIALGGPMENRRGQGFEPPPAPGPAAQRGFRPVTDRGQKTDIVSIILFVTVWSLSTAICIIRQWRLTEQRAVLAEADKANAELTFLKAQINPHFLFNTLNNIYSLAITGSDKTPASIMKLSNILRYVTDDIREDFVLLDEEIDCLRDYIDLQKMRLGKNMSVYFNVQGETTNRKIAPLILMTFIENVFKYGISNHEQADIDIGLVIDNESIVFNCANKIYDTQRNLDRKGNGIGIDNTRQRLQHLYPGTHSLSIENDGKQYKIHLVLNDKKLKHDS